MAQPTQPSLTPAISHLDDNTYPIHLFRLLLFQRLRLPLPLFARFCRRRRSFDFFGSHRLRSLDFLRCARGREQAAV